MLDFSNCEIGFLSDISKNDDADLYNPISANSWIIMVFSVKKTTRHYVGSIEKQCNQIVYDHFPLGVMRKKKTFKYSEMVDVSIKANKNKIHTTFRNLC